jgi:thiamine-monophosphate kinase
VDSDFPHGMGGERGALKVSDIGEQGLLGVLLGFCPPTIVGDDAAVLDVPVGRSLVVTTDVLVDNVHFSDRTTRPEDAGWRAAAANLSDLAAMGAAPLGITVGLGLPGDLELAWVEGLYHGLTACLQQYDTQILGGDICRSPTITIAITAFGHVDPLRVLRRSAAQVGDAIVVTGSHGNSRAGLELLLNPAWGTDLEASAKAALIHAHQRPNPRLDVLPLLPSIRVAAMDSSDGLADAILQICRASGVGARVQGDRLPCGVCQPPSPPQALTDLPLEWVLYGGEDFELVLCLDPAAAEVFVAKLGSGAAVIGEITPGSEVILQHPSQSAPIALSLERGFQHFGTA